MRFFSVVGYSVEGYNRVGFPPLWDRKEEVFSVV
jgi:hypothetical protein